MPNTSGSTTDRHQAQFSFRNDTKDLINKIQKGFRLPHDKIEAIQKVLDFMNKEPNPSDTRRASYWNFLWELFHYGGWWRVILPLADGGSSKLKGLNKVKRKHLMTLLDEIEAKAGPQGKYDAFGTYESLQYPAEQPKVLHRPTIGPKAAQRFEEARSPASEDASFQTTLERECIERGLLSPTLSSRVDQKFDECIRRGLLTPLEDDVQISGRGRSAMRSPTIYNGDDCLQQQPKPLAILGEAIRNCGQGVAYDNGHTLYPLSDIDEACGRVVTSLTSPEAEEYICFFMNIVVTQYMKIPHELTSYAAIYEPSSKDCSANLTPTGTVADLHIDLGMAGLSATVGDCVKIWALYPPTPHNLDLLYAQSEQEGKFLKLAERLHDGRYALTTKNQTIYLPPGWLHAVYTRKGGVLIGINWNCATDTEITKHIFTRELRSERKAAAEVALPFSRASIIALKTYDTMAKTRVASMWCDIYADVSATAPYAPETKQLFEELDKEYAKCPQCDKSWGEHASNKRRIASNKRRNASNKRRKL